MLLNTPAYWLFLVAAFLLYCVLGKSARWIGLLFASLLFYAALGQPLLLLYLALVAIVSFACGLLIAARPDSTWAKLTFWTGVAFNLLVLFFSRYRGSLLTAAGAASTIGVSFYTFQSITYLADVFLGKLPAERHFGHFFLYLGFFPKLLQGPIERGDELLPQLKNLEIPTYEAFRSAGLLFLWGLFKKAVIADRLALLVDPVYDDVHRHSGLSLLFATYLYAFQLYSDFSGYTDMARGSARLFGIRLTENFNSPYLSTSIADFWRRWHISLSRCLLDYLFKPLQLVWRRWRTVGTALALFVTFLISGVWHGARAGFVVWGLLHGVFLAVETFYRPVQKRIHRSLKLEGTRILQWWQILVTFHLVTFAWIFFRAASLDDAWYVVRQIFSRDTLSRQSLLAGLPLSLGQISQSYVWFLIATSSLLLMAVGPTLVSRLALLSRAIWIRWSAYAVLLVWIVFFFTRSRAGFLYGRF